MSERPTPETDDQPILYALNELEYQVLCVDLEFARKLERERDEANQIISSALAVLPVGYIPKHTAEIIPNRIADLCNEIANLERERDEALEQNAKLRKIAERAIWRMVAGVCLPDTSAVRAIKEEGLRLRAELEQIKEEAK